MRQSQLRRTMRLKKIATYLVGTTSCIQYCKWRIGSDFSRADCYVGGVPKGVPVFRPPCGRDKSRKRTVGDVDQELCEYISTLLLDGHRQRKLGERCTGSASCVASRRPVLPLSQSALEGVFTRLHHKVSDPASCADACLAPAHPPWSLRQSWTDGIMLQIWVVRILRAWLFLPQVHQRRWNVNGFGVCPLLTWSRSALFPDCQHRVASYCAQLEGSA